MDFQTYLSSTELAALAETEQWLNAGPSRFKKVMSFTRKPIEFAYHKVPESLRESIASAILNVLTAVQDGSSSWTTSESVLDKVREQVGPLNGPEELFQVPLQTLDGVVQTFLKNSKNACTAEGAVAGVAGLPGIVVDVPALYGLLFRMIAQVGLCYGFEVQPEEERTHMLKVLEIGHLTETEEKLKGMAEVDRLQEMIRQNLPVVEVQRFAIQKGLQTLARHLGLALTQRKLAQSVVLFGGVIGAGVNRQLAGEVGEVAFHAYRRRHLMERASLRSQGKLKMPGLAEPKSSPGQGFPQPPSYQ